MTAHGFCLSWAPGLIAVHVISDALIGLAYFSIPLAIAAVVRRRGDLQYGWIAYLFVAFILACGSTHLWSIVTLWYPAYGVEGVIKAVTAVLSVATAVLLWPLIPRLVALPSSAELERLNAELAARVEAEAHTAALLRDSEAKLQAANAQLELRVAERTAELVSVNARLELALQERTTALSQRDLLLREVYHRVKNNLQIIDSLLVMQSRELADGPAKAAFGDMRSRIYALGLVHEQLMGSPDLETFDVAPFLKALVANILAGGARRDVALDVRAAPLDVGLDFGIPLGLLVTELVTNSLKHAFPEGSGAIEVSLDRKADGAVVLVVADDGVGLPSAPSPNAKGSRRSLGARIIDGLVSQLGGVMKVNGEAGVRTEVRLAARVAA
jgi:two-component sensor histidine kinase